MKKCKSCQKEIDAKANKCPYCQTDQRNWVSRHPIITALLVLIILGMIGSASSSNKTKKVGNTNNTTTTASTNEQPTETARVTKTYKMGELVDLDGKTVSINAVAPYTSGNQFMTPKSGNKYMTVDITLKNNSKDPYMYNPLEFKLDDNQDYGYSMAISDKDPTLSSGTLQPGETTRGFITFEIPEANTPTKVVYTPGFWNLSQIIIDVTQQ